MAEIMCNAAYELAPHQQFVRNFLSSQTPYNSMLLFHGLGSGKTCSAISVAEEARDYFKYAGISGANKIIVIASPNVQNNFKEQLFDEKNLKYDDTHGWVINNSCVGFKLLKEVMLSNRKRLSNTNEDKNYIIKNINRIINKHYLFKGYEQFHNYFKKGVDKKQIKKMFGDSVIIVDEVHNIRTDVENSETKKEEKRAQTMKGVTEALEYLAENANNTKLLFLSATPMYNSPKEIVLLLSIMNMNDGRGRILAKEIFDKDGNFKINMNTGEKTGLKVLEQRARGYISFVRGENPYTFPYRMWPTNFSKNASFLANELNRPIQKLNETELVQGIENLDIFVTPISPYQETGYNYIMNQIRSSESNNYFDNDKVSYNIIQKPIQALNILYPHEDLDMNMDMDMGRVNVSSASVDIKELVGKQGLERIMSCTEVSKPVPSRYDFKYKNLKATGPIFSPSEIGKYSAKIKTICDHIVNSEGVVLVYSQYIDGGLLPMALALEQLGFARSGESGTKSHLFAKKFLPKKRDIKFKYAMITGDKAFSPNNAKEMKLITSPKNKDGEEVKVVLISRAGSEGLDFKFIRQVHVMEPWYNMNRIEQIIGRAVRTCSHKQLEFSKRNVEIYLHCLSLTSRVESADAYLYRKAEKKAIQIGSVSRALKEVSADCLLNIEQAGFTEENMNQVVKLQLSSLADNGQPKRIEYRVGDKPFSSTCDYMERCEYKCKSNDDGSTTLDTYNDTFMLQDTEQIKSVVRDLMVERFFYRKQQLVAMLNATKPYPASKIDAALNELVENREPIVDKFGRLGRLIHTGDLYLFQPQVLDNDRISVYERTRPVEKKIRMLKVKVPKPQVLEGFESAGNNVIQEILKKYDFVIGGDIDVMTIKTEFQQTYTLCKETYARMISTGKDVAIMKKLLVARLMEELNYDDLFNVMTYLLKEDGTNEREEEIKAFKEYLKSREFKNTNNPAISYVLYEVNKNGSYNAIKTRPSQQNEKECVKDPKLEKDSVADANNKFKSLKVHVPYYFMGYVKEGDKFHILKKIKQLGLPKGVKVASKERVDEEFEFRYKDATDKEGKRWFLTLVEHGFTGNQYKGKGKVKKN